MGTLAGITCWPALDAQGRRGQHYPLKPDPTALILIIVNFCPFPVEMFVKADSGYSHVGVSLPNTQMVDVFSGEQLGDADSVQVAATPVGAHDVEEWPARARKPNMVALLRVTLCTPPPEPAKT